MKKEIMSLSSNLKRQSKTYYWLDAFKFGLATAFCVVPVYIFLKIIMAFVFGINLP